MSDRTAERIWLYGRRSSAVDTGNAAFSGEKEKFDLPFLESMESTFSSKEEGGAMEQNRIPELTALAKEGVNFSGDEKNRWRNTVEGASWTTGAMVSQTCAYPVMIPLGGKNYQNEKNTFMPGAVSMGDVLKKRGICAGDHGWFRSDFWWTEDVF